MGGKYLANMANITELLFIIVVDTAVSGLQKGDINGDLGPSNMFSSDSVEFLGSVVHADESQDCCKACKAQYPSTQLFDFHILYMYCQCSKVKNNVTPATDLYSTYVAGICG